MDEGLSLVICAVFNEIQFGLKWIIVLCSFASNADSCVEAKWMLCNVGYALFNRLWIFSTISPSSSSKVLILEFSKLFLQVSMMAETPNHAHIKQEIDTTSCCSPAPSSGTFNSQGFIYNSSPAAATPVSIFDSLVFLCKPIEHLVFRHRLNWNTNVHRTTTTPLATTTTTANHIHHLDHRIVSFAVRPHRSVMRNSRCTPITQTPIRRSYQGDCA